MIEKRVKGSETLATYMMLPMLKLNKASFGVGNFSNCYVDRKGLIIVDLVDITKATESSTVKHEHYLTDYNVDDVTRIIYDVPKEYIDDIAKFEKGAYSQLSSDYKVALSKYGLLGQNDIIMKSLNPQMEDRQKIADDLGVKVSLVKELKSAPSENNFLSVK